MCCYWEKKTLQRWGMILTIAFLAGAIVCIILAGINYNVTAIDWSNGGWKSLAAVEIASIIYVISTCVVGFLTFCCDWWCLTLIFSILLIISMMFTFAIAIFGLVAGSVSKVESYLGCSTNYTGVLEMWNNLDKYLINVDTALCSNNCACGFTNATAYETNSTIKPYYDNWVKNGTAIAFQNCSGAVQTAAIQSYQQTSNTTIDQTLFSNYWTLIEQKFECTGWCQSSYSVNNTTNVMWKYLFSGINRGPPKYLGCLKNVVDWLPGLLHGFGAIALIVSVVQALVFVMAISLCCAQKSKK